MTTPIDVDPSASQASPEAVTEGIGAKAIEGRSLRQIAWMRLRRDKVALVGAAVVVLLILLAVFASVITHFIGGSPLIYHQDLIDPTFAIPKGSFGGMSLAHPLGVEPFTGRDVLSRVLYGARISLTVALLATVLTVVLGTVLGVTAGYFGGWVDWLISRAMDVLLAFPVLLFAIALGTILLTVNQIWIFTGASLSVVVLVIIIGFFQFPYIGRIIRGQTLSLREKEFVEAARSLGAGSGHILFKQLVPNLVAPIIVYSTLIIPTNITFEAALSFLGVGVRPPTPSWGSMLSNSTQTFQTDPAFMIVPGLALFITVLAFNLFGDGLRDALDPRTNR